MCPAGQIHGKQCTSLCSHSRGGQSQAGMFLLPLPYLGPRASDTASLNSTCTSQELRRSSSPVTE
jgi:hypothetical protein